MSKTPPSTAKAPPNTAKEPLKRPKTCQRPKAYRKNVAAIIVNCEGRLLACRRSDRFASWQLPQGGIDEGETAEAALMRELDEEIGTNKVSIVHRLEDPIRYEWPEHLYERGYRGQEQVYFLLRIDPETRIPLEECATEEFDAISWLTSIEFLSKVEGFKAEAYKQAIESFSELFPGVFSQK